MVSTLDDEAAAASVTSSKPALAFKIAAFAEAVSWIGLLIGMFFKWIVQSGDVGVRVFGPIHGTIFILYVISLLWVSTSHKWSAKDTLLGLFSSIPPLMTVWFERRAERRGALVRHTA
ncbi:DUF3817 domain-containing protein [Flexivirga sp. B27]